jgi:hypothetical protein
LESESKWLDSRHRQLADSAEATSQVGILAKRMEISARFGACQQGSLFAIPKND